MFYQDGCWEARLTWKMTNKISLVDLFLVASLRLHHVLTLFDRGLFPLFPLFLLLVSQLITCWKLEVGWQTRSAWKQKEKNVTVSFSLQSQRERERKLKSVPGTCAFSLFTLNDRNSLCRVVKVKVSLGGKKKKPAFRSQRGNVSFIKAFVKAAVGLDSAGERSFTSHVCTQDDRQEEEST